MVERACLTKLCTWPSTTLTAGSIPGNPISWGCPSPPVIQLESSQCPQTFITLTRFSSGNRKMSKGAREEVCVHYGLILQVLEYKNSVLFPVVTQWTGHKFFSNLLHVEVLVKMCRPKMLKTPLIFHHVLKDELIHFNPDFYQSTWKSTTTIWLLFKLNTIQRFVFYSIHYHNEVLS